MTLLQLHFGATAIMVGVIWVAQLVHYPMFAVIEERHFSKFTAFHAARISWVVVPAMLTELGTALLTLAFGLPKPLWAWILASALLVVAWLVTFLIAMPCHQRLHIAGKDLRIIERLVYTNWLRTMAWSARLILIALVL